MRIYRRRFVITRIAYSVIAIKFANNNATIQCRFLSYVYNPFYSSRLIKYSTVPFYLLLWPMNSHCNTGTFLQFLLVLSLAAFTKNMFLSQTCWIQVFLLNGSQDRGITGLSASDFVVAITESLKNCVSLFYISLTVYCNNMEPWRSRTFNK